MVDEHQLRFLSDRKKSFARCVISHSFLWSDCGSEKTQKDIKQTERHTTDK